jgi:hypothetical protein
MVDGEILAEFVEELSARRPVGVEVLIENQDSHAN